MRLEVLPVPGIGEVAEGDDLAGLIATAAPWLRDGDVLVVTSKIVSKAEGRLVAVPQDGPEREAAREETLVAETARPVARRGATRIVQTHHGFVMAAAGIDSSNVDRGHLVLLPRDPDASARALRAGLRERHGANVAVIISDTMGRPWRNGLTDVALGVAGMAAIRDHRGEVDPYGNELHVTQMAVIDELAGAGELVKGKCDRVPVAVVRGYLGSAVSVADGGEDGAGAAVLVRDAELDLFSLGTAEARVSGLRLAAALNDAPELTGAPPDPATVQRAIAAVADAVAPGTVFTPVADEGVRKRLADDIPGWPGRATGLIICAPPTAPDDPGDIPAAPASAPTPAAQVPPVATLIRFGADLHRLRSALVAEGIPSTLLTAAPGGAAAAVLAI